MGTFVPSGVNSVSGNILKERVYNFLGFSPSGINTGCILGVGLYVYSGTISKVNGTTTGGWIPLRREWLGNASST